MKSSSDAKQARCELEVQATPTLHDASELSTILISSIRALFGELEHYSCNMKVKKVASENHSFVVECPGDSVAAIRSALCMVTPPPYLNSTIYRFDVLKLKSL